MGHNVPYTIRKEVMVVENFPPPMNIGKFSQWTSLEYDQERYHVDSV